MCTTYTYVRWVMYAGLAFDLGPYVQQVELPTYYLLLTTYYLLLTTYYLGPYVQQVELPLTPGQVGHPQSSSVTWLGVGMGV